MSVFTASNGVQVIEEENGCVIISRPQSLLSSPDAASEDRQAILEWAEHTRDAALGRWRWPENPAFVVYAARDEDDGVHWSVDERTGESHMNTRAGLQSDEHARAARAYFDAHPEPKPWHEAKPGEVWIIVTRNVGEERAVQVHGDQFHYNDGFEFPLTYEAIESARRVWPEATS